MATINLGAIKFNWKGAYNNSTAYAVDDVVSSGGNSYVCIQASTGNAVGNATAYWNIMSSAGTNGTNGTDLSTTLTTQGDILYRDGSGLQRLGAGTNGQALLTGGTGANPSWGTISSGTYSVHAMDRYYNNSAVSTNSNNYVDIANGNTVNFQPTSTNDRIFIAHYCSVEVTTGDSGCDVYMNMGTSSSLGSGDTKLNFDGNHANYNSSNQMYTIISKSFILMDPLVKHNF